MSTRRAGNMAIRYRAASHRGHDQIVQLLLEAGADINAQCGCHGSALQAAIVKGHGQIVERLLERGADVNGPGGSYDNALQAAEAYGYEQILQLLKSNQWCSETLLH
jgi:ankyrin repeat protein